MHGRIMAAMTAFAVAAAGCDSDPAANDTARVSVRLTDAPGDLASASVEIVEVYLQSGADDGAGDGRVSLFSGSRTFDLLDLQNGVTEELSEVLVPAGSYSQLRLVVGDATITTESGATYSTEDNTLLCPSCAQSGFKINLPGGTVDLENDTHILLIDFDVAQSFGHAAGQSGRWVMHPVMTATELETSGVIDGSVVLAEGVTLPVCGGSQTDLTDFVATAAAGEIVLSGFTTAEGDVRFPFVAPGSYAMGFAETVDFDNSETLTFAGTVSPQSVTVSSGSTATVGYTITSATCGPTPTSDGG
jgi:hypothetical protein